jgi:hypothetical protein
MRPFRRSGHVSHSAFTIIVSNAKISSGDSTEGGLKRFQQAALTGGTTVRPSRALEILLDEPIGAWQFAKSFVAVVG